MTKEDDLTYHALRAAQRTFMKYLEDRNYDTSYWDIRFTSWELDSNFERRLRRVEIESEVKAK